MSLLNSLTSIIDNSKKRVGRGYGSGKGGHTSSRGQKGQKSREGGSVPLWFEGGQLPIIKRMPMMRGKARFKVVRPTAEVNLSAINKMKSDIISLDTLILEKVIDKKFKKAKVIAGGKLEKKVTLKGLRVSASARKEIESLGGKIED